MRMRVQTMRSLAFTGFAVTIVLLVLVLIPGIGKEANGSRGWFVVAGLLHAAVGAGQDRIRDLGCAPAGRPPHGTGVAAGDAHPAGARGGDRARAHRRPARPRADGVARHHPAGPAVVRRPAAAGVPVLDVRRRGLGGGDPRGVGGLPVRPRDVVAEPRRRRAGLRLSGQAGEVRAGQRRCLRRRPWPGHGQVELPAQRAQRLHLRDHRRGTRASSGRRVCCACSACSPTPACGSRAGQPTRSCGC